MQNPRRVTKPKSIASTHARICPRIIIIRINSLIASVELATKILCELACVSREAPRFLAFNSELSELSTRGAIDSIWLCKNSKMPLFTTRSSLVLSFRLHISSWLSYPLVYIKWLQGNKPTQSRTYTPGIRLRLGTNLAFLFPQRHLSLSGLNNILRYSNLLETITLATLLLFS